MSASLRKGWCPGALRPMAAKDGLLVRLRITGGILSAAVAHALADLSARYGNARLDLSARGNLQMRGVSDASLPGLHDGLRALDLLDRDGAGEAVRNVIANPLAGLHAGLDIRPLARALEARLTRDGALHALPGKFGFLIDDGTAPSLAGVDADIRFDWMANDECFAIGLGGTRRQAAHIGFCKAADLPERAAAMARSAVSLSASLPEGRRMRDLIAAHGVDHVARSCDGEEIGLTVGATRDTTARDVVGRRTFAPGDPTCLGLAVPFGRLDASMLRAAATGAALTPIGELRLTPWRTILVPSAPLAATSVDGFITDPADPRLAIAACVGADGCTRGTTSPQADATHLASHLAATMDPGIVLHLSGCAKGCAKPSATRLTLVARDGRYDLVREGRAGDRPARLGLDLAAVRGALLEPA